jgi:hypothetical protein
MFKNILNKFWGFTVQINKLVTAIFVKLMMVCGHSLFCQKGGHGHKKGGEGSIK